VLWVEEDGGRYVYLIFLGEFVIETEFMQLHFAAELGKGANYLFGGMIVDVVISLLGEKIKRNCIRQLIKYHPELVLNLRGDGAT